MHKLSIGVAALALLCGFSFGCGSAGNDDGAAIENTASATEPLYYGAVWANPVSSSVTGSSYGSNPALEVCLMTMEDGTQQCGKVYGPSRGPLTCRAEYGGRADETTNYKLLYNDGRYGWADAAYGLPSNAVVGDVGGALPGSPSTHVYVCQALYNGFWHPGKWWQNACRIEYADKGATIQTYGHTGAIYILTHP